MVKNKKNRKIKIFLLGMICFNLLSLIVIDTAFSAELNTKAILKRDGQNLVLSANNKNYKLSCKTPGCIVYKCIQYGCRNGWQKYEDWAARGCWNEGDLVKCKIYLRIDDNCTLSAAGAPSHDYDWIGTLNPDSNCFYSGYRRRTYDALAVRCDWNSNYFEFHAEKYCVKTECMTNGCTEWEINSKDFLALFPSVGIATIDPNNIEF